MYYLEYTIGSSMHVCEVWFSNQRNANFHLRSHQKSLIRDAFEENKEKKQNFVSTFMDFSNTGSCKCLNIFNSMKFDKIQLNYSENEKCEMAVQIMNTDVSRFVYMYVWNLEYKSTMTCLVNEIDIHLYIKIHSNTYFPSYII